ncbi:MAG: 3-oxoacyl-ACP synthase, partial [Myxococcales bacterium]|nr:3-oxoacyl-ACP synthase [Myxococcales bacterium]
MRIWITGVGLLTALGRDATSSFHGICKGRRGFREVTLFDTAGCRTTVAGELADFTVDEVAGPGGGAGWSRTDAMAVAAARQALAACPEELPVDLVVGGTTAGMLETEDLLLTLHRDGRAPRDSTAGMLSHPLSATMDRLVAAVRPFGKGRAICSACSSGANALVLAAAWLRTGRSERVLAGGADGLCRVTFTGFNSLGALSPEPCLPFDARRDGLTLGEGAAFLLVETEAAARARGAEPIVELRGWAVASEAHHITNPEPAGTTAAEVMRRALAMGGLAPEDVDYVNA